MLDPKRKLFRWGPISGCPLFMDYTVVSSFAPMKKIFGVGYPEALVIYKNNKVTWLLDDKDLFEQGRKFLKKVLSDKQKQEEYFQLWSKKTNGLLKVLESLCEDLSRKSDEELAREFQQLSRVYYEWWAVTMTFELVAVSVEPLLGTRLKEYFSEKSDEYNKAFSVLTSPLKLTFYREEQKNLSRILRLPKEKRQGALVGHQKKFYWIYNSYLRAKVLSVSFFAEELAKLEKTDYKKLLHTIEDYPIQIKKDKEQILTKINADDELRNLIFLAQRFAELQDERKTNNFRVEHWLEIFVREFAKRTSGKVSDLKLLLPEELKEIFDSLDKRVIDLRRTCSVFHCTTEKIEETNGEDGLVLAKRFDGVEDINESIIHGVLASSGNEHYFRGTAKLVLSIEEIKKVEEGDIIVTTMTSPDFVIGMKKAGAIITDVGGILSHAAVVSRELGKPCIVSTKIATKVIRDGDVLELHCGKGTVKIIRSSER